MDNYLGPDDDWYAGESSIDEAVDRLFRQLTNPLINPHHNECLVCFLLRVVPLLEPSGFAMTRRYRDSNAPRAIKLGDRLEQLGISGDFQLLQAGVVCNSNIWEVERCPDCGVPADAPYCFGVRKGSTQPCELWTWRRNALAERLEDWLDRPY